jgi:hypothetical protein
MSPKNEDVSGFSALGLLYSWVDRPGSVNKLTAVLAVLCLLSVVADFTYEKYGHFAEESTIGFYAIYGFISFTLLIFVARGLRVLMMRPENFYGDKAVDAETQYPADQIDMKGHDDV